MKKNFIFLENNPTRKDWIYNFLCDSTQLTSNPMIIGIDWAYGYGMIRGEIVKKEGNVIYVRFKTIE